MRTFITLAAIAAVSVQAWDEVYYGRRTNYSNRGHSGPKNN